MPRDVRVVSGAECGSDHYLVRGTFVLKIHKLPNKQNADNSDSNKHEIVRYCLDSLSQESTKYLFKNRASLGLGSNEKSISEQYDSIKNCLHKAAFEALGLDNRKKKNIYWWNEEAEELVGKKKNLFQKWLATKDADVYEDYKRINRAVKKKRKEWSNKYWENTCNRINTYIGGQKSAEAWQVLKEIKNPKPNKINRHLIRLADWRDYFAKLLEDRPSFFNGQTPFSTNEEFQAQNIFPVTVAELEDAIKEMQNKKSPWPGDIPIELIKNSVPDLKDKLASIFTECINGAEIPSEWTVGYIIPVYKKGSKKECKNYRGIRLQIASVDFMGEY
ncbi:uncharacterized protein [Rhodnius prolixus]|uniref:uncharacterized protein n=1 Tax=Rhodnius prolixus TaxID=13249 RepID=UPI003D189EA4